MMMMMMMMIMMMMIMLMMIGDIVAVVSAVVMMMVEVVATHFCSYQCDVVSNAIPCFSTLEEGHRHPRPMTSYPLKTTTHRIHITLTVRCR